MFQKELNNSKVTGSQTVTKGNTTYSDSKRVRNRARSWCFTLNNYIEEDVVTLSHPKWENMGAKKIVFQEEIGEDSKIPHLQGVVQFNESVSFSSLKAFHDKIHWEKCRDLKASIKYCSKENTRNGKLYTYGVNEKQLWKGKKPKGGLDLFGPREMYASMREQMQDELELNKAYKVWQHQRLISFEEDLSDSTPSPSPGEGEASPPTPS